MASDNQQTSSVPDEKTRQAVIEIKRIYEEAKAKLLELQKKQDEIIGEFTKKFEQEQLDKIRQQYSDI